MDDLFRALKIYYLTSMTNPGKTPPKREYPILYEKSVPILIGVLLFVIVIMVIFAIGVALGIFG